MCELRGGSGEGCDMAANFPTCYCSQITGDDLLVAR